MKKIKFLENIMAHFKNDETHDDTDRIRLYNEYVDAQDHERAEFMLHNAKSDYIDPLRKALTKIVGDKKTRKFNENKIVFSNANKDEYVVVVGAKAYDSKNYTERIQPYLKISLTANSIDDMTFTMSDIQGAKIQDFHIKNSEDYKAAENSICTYITDGPGSWILRKG